MGWNNLRYYLLASLIVLVVIGLSVLLPAYILYIVLQAFNVYVAYYVCIFIVLLVEFTASLFRTGKGDWYGNNRNKRIRKIN